MPIFFTHIQKVAGTSFKKSVIYPNIDEQDIYSPSGMWQLLKNRERKFQFLDGHYSYGAHWFAKCRGPNIYFSILREPLDRCVSYYYFVRQCDTPDYKHPNLQDVKQLDIAQLYSLEKYRNRQTKSTAGFLATRLAAYLPGRAANSLLLSQAKHNLSRCYAAFGLFERIEEFQALVAKMMGWKNLNVRDQTKTSHHRPKVREITPEVKQAILDRNGLDVQLYRFAADLYQQRLDSWQGKSLANVLFLGEN